MVPVVPARPSGALRGGEGEFNGIHVASKKKRKKRRDVEKDGERESVEKKDALDLILESPIGSA